MSGNASDHVEQGLAQPQDGDELTRLRAAHQDLLRAISHDLRAPLRHVTAFAPLLRELVDTPALGADERAEALEFLGTMENAGQRMALMLEGLLALSRVQSAPLRIEAVDLDKLTRQVLGALSPLTPGRFIEWSIDGLPTVQADADLLRQALFALLGNAVKFTAHAPAARVRVGAHVGLQGETVLHIEDNGVGFDMERSQGLFGLFQRLHPERHFKGVGAGLALVRAVAERHGGSVRARAEPGLGCTVTMGWKGQ